VTYFQPFLFAIVLLEADFCTNAIVAERPDIIVVLADDLGYSDLGDYDGEINTPNIDALAAGGAKLT